MTGKINPMRRKPQRLTASNYKAFIKARALQKGYRERIHKLKPQFLKTSKAASVPRPLHEFQPRMAVDLIKYFNIRVGDLVNIRFGPDRNKKGIVLETLVNRNHVIVENCNLRKQIFVPLKNGQTKKVYVEMPIHVTNVAPVDPVTKKITRLKIRRMLTGEFVRLSSQSGSAMPLPVPIWTCRDKILYYKRNIFKQLDSLLVPLNIQGHQTAQKTTAKQTTSSSSSRNSVLDILAERIINRQKSLIPHSLLHCRAVESELQPEYLVKQWAKMRATVEDRMKEVPSKVPPINLK